MNLKISSKNDLKDFWLIFIYLPSHEKEQDLMSIHLINDVKIKCYVMRMSEKRAMYI